MNNEFINLLVELFGEGNVEIISPNRLEGTIENMLSSDYKKRFKAEYQQLLIRYQNLCSFIKRAELGKEKHDCDLSLLKQQRLIMSKYLDILVNRASQEGCDLL